MVKVADLPSFDAADYLDSEEAIAAYLNAIMEENNFSDEKISERSMMLIPMIG